jgi:hypothetical protein
MSTSAVGGAIQVGIYHHVSNTYYGGNGGSCANVVMSSTWQFVPTSATTGTGSVSQTVSPSTSVNQFTFHYETSGTLFTFTYACGGGGSISYGYTATTNEILLYGDGCGPGGYIGRFAKQ